MNHRGGAPAIAAQVSLDCSTESRFKSLLLHLLQTAEVLEDAVAEALVVTDSSRAKGFFQTNYQCNRLLF